MPNPFQEAEAWEPQTEALLPAGNYVVTIETAENSTSSGQHPQIELIMSNDEGRIRDWLVITPNSVGKIVALAQAAGVRIPEDDDIDNTETLRLKDSYTYQFNGRKVGIVIRDEQKYGGDIGEMIPRVQGYVKPEKIGPPSDATPPGAENAFAHKQAKTDRPIPF